MKPEAITDGLIWCAAAITAAGVGVLGAITKLIGDVLALLGLTLCFLLVRVV